MCKTAIVTGASKGIGKEIAISLAKKGHQIWALARSKEALEKLKNQYPDNIQYLATDLTDVHEIQIAVESISEHSTSIDILINNAGSLINKPFHELTNEDWENMLNANLMSTVNLTKALLPFLNKKSHIINIGSMGGVQGSSKFPGLTAYSVAKGAISILSECLAVEFFDRQISVNALCLGSVKTKMFNQAFPEFDADVKAESMGTYIADFALNGSTFYNGKILPVALSNPS